jgi:RNAse (barnase) inhibitor barstar
MLSNHSGFTFLAHPEDCARNLNDFVASVPSDLPDRQTLFDALAKKLHFPAYFGHNWDALYDVLCDFSWITSRRIILVHDELPVGMGEDNLRVYLKILRDAVKCWQPGEAHELVVVFPSSSQEVIHSILR